MGEDSTRDGALRAWLERSLSIKILPLFTTKAEWLQLLDEEWSVHKEMLRTELPWTAEMNELSCMRDTDKIIEVELIKANCIDAYSLVSFSTNLVKRSDELLCSFHFSAFASSSISPLNPTNELNYVVFIFDVLFQTTETV